MPAGQALITSRCQLDPQHVDMVAAMDNEYDTHSQRAHLLSFATSGSACVRSKIMSNTSAQAWWTLPRAPSDSSVLLKTEGGLSAVMEQASINRMEALKSGPLIAPTS